MELTSKQRHIHFVGIGGIGMSGIAEVLLTLGFTVSGSDLAASDATERLGRLGATIALGHHADRVGPTVDVVVISSAVKFSNPEVVRARELKIPVIPRAEMLAELMRMKTALAVAGTHGKTTTTSMLGHVLAQADLDPTLVIGGKVKGLGSNARLGQSRFLVAEADESDGSFLLLTPTHAVVTNIDPEHLDHYGSIERMHEAYLQFINRVPFYGLAVLCLDSVAVRALLPRVRKRFLTYGLASDADLQAVHTRVSADGTRFDVLERGRWIGEIALRMPGRHNAQNALAVIAVACELGIAFETIARALASFEGIHRRFEVKGEIGGVTVVDDYGHHPEEVKATLRAAREGFGRRLVAIFQPHRYTRTRDLFSDFLGAFDDADLLVLTEIYPAGEDRIEGVSGEALYEALRRRGHADVRFVSSRAAVVEALLPDLRGGDMVVTLGAGDVHKVGDELLHALARERPAALQ
ncbi:MAG: UDP-N-acetylmuramate--L-alanine ligase [Deltaproteobacteria bacterium]|nr:UDP-N-acetylmuramate--L-alanine ligase [Deltaproteobacteria bacterium]